ncbi:hypothetical protein ACQX3A_11070 [Corynebacterium diphtheriae]
MQLTVGMYQHLALLRGCNYDYWHAKYTLVGLHHRNNRRLHIQPSRHKSRIRQISFHSLEERRACDPDFVVKIARAYNANVLEALVAAGFITEAEAKLQEIKVGGITLNDASNQQLLDEIMHRLDSEANRMSGDPTDKNIDCQQRDELAERRRSSPTPPPHVTVISDDELAAAIREAHQLRGAAHPATTELTEPETP